MKFFSKKQITVIFILILFSGLFLVNINKAGANILGTVSKDILQGISDFLLSIAQLFTGLMGKLFTAILNYGFKKFYQEIVYTGWTITRDIVNMFFILGLIIIAGANILRIETYMMKNLLPKLVIIALIINFSYLACGLIIDASQIIANYFVSQIKTSTDPNATPDVGLAILSTLKASKALSPTTATAEGQSVTITTTDVELTTALNTLFSAVIIGVAGFVLLIGAILLFLRVGALWLLIILAPFAWFFSVFPALKSHADKWWSELLKWAFFAPIYTFFIYLILRISQETLKIAGGSPNAMSGIALTEMMSNLDLFFYYVFLVVLLLGAPMVAMSMGIKAAGTATTIAKGALKGAVGIPLKLKKAASTMAPPAWMEKHVPIAAKVMRGIQQTAAFTSLEFWKKAREARKAERLRKARIPHVIGKQQDILNLLYSLGSEKTNYAEQAEQFEVAERKKEVEGETKRVGPRLIAKLETALKQRDIITYKACLELLQEQGDTNDAMMSDLGLFDNLKFDDKYVLNKLKGQNVNDEKDRRFSNLGFKHGIIQQMKKMGLSEKEIAPFLGKLQEIGLQSGYFGLYGMAKTDNKGNMIIASDEEQIKVAAAKIKTQTARARTSKMHGTTIGMQGIDEKGQYKFAGRDDVSDEMLRTFTLADVDKTNMEYVRPDTQTLTYQAYEQEALKGISATANALGKKIHDAILGEKEGKPKKEEKEKEGGKKTKEGIPTDKDREAWRKKQGFE